MPNPPVPADSGAVSAWLPFANDARSVSSKGAANHFDAIRADAERELMDHVRSRHDLEALIERLIAGLDFVDALDEECEPFDEGDALDAGEAVNEDGDPLDEAELDEGSHDLSTQAETYGRGWGIAAVEAAQRESLFSDAIRPALFISWKAGRCASAAFVPGEGRAQA